MPILTISSTIATWDWTLELIVSLTDYDRIGGRERAYVIITVSYKFGRRLGRQPLSFSVIGWTGGSYGVEGHEVEDTRNDMTFLTVLLARREVTTYRLWRDRTKEMFGGVMDQEMGSFVDQMNMKGTHLDLLPLATCACQ